MKRIALALVVVSGVVGAQSQPFDFTVPFPGATRLQGSLRFDLGYADAYGAGQAAEVDLPLGSRVVLMATSNLAYERFGSLQGAGQLEAMVDAIRFAGWHLAVSGGARRAYDGTGIAIGRLIFSRTTETWSFAVNADASKLFSGFDLTLHHLWQYYGSVGATKTVGSGVSLGVETLASYNQVATTVFAGPVASFALPGGRARLDVSGGPILLATGLSGLVPDYTIVERYAMPVPAHPSGYTLRLGVSLGL